MWRLLLFALLAGVFSGSACAATSASADPEFQREEEAWQQRRLLRLKSESGWLTLVGLHWLAPGENRFGSDPDNEIVLTGGTVPGHTGSFVLENGRVRVRATPEAGLTLDDKPVTDLVVRSDETGEPDALRLGRLVLTVIKRGDRYAIRVRDKESPARTGFRGLDYFPPDPRYRVTAVFTPYDPPKEVAIPTILGTVEKMTAPGFVTFTLEGQSLTLEPVLEEPEAKELFFIFKDQTSGKETYPAGRYLYTELPQSGRVVLDFNRAYNPPCAFTPYATCPFPPKQNQLPVRVEAGEKVYGKH